MTSERRLIRGEQLVDDEYTDLADDAPAPSDGALIVSLARWTAERGALPAGGRRVGVRIPNTVDVATLLPEMLQGAQAIVLEFPSFGDGRAYSQARILRDRLGWRGELRATGAAVVRDQLQGMLRCGIDAFELRADQSPERCLAALREFTLAYQPGADGLVRVSALRRGSGTS